MILIAEQFAHMQSGSFFSSIVSGGSVGEAMSSKKSLANRVVAKMFIVGLTQQYLGNFPVKFPPHINLTKLEFLVLKN